MDKKFHATPHAFTVPFDKNNNPSLGFSSDNVQEAIEELRQEVASSASPGWSFGKSGNVTSNSWLLVDGSVPSNKAGKAIYLSDCFLEAVYVRCENASTFTVEVYEHDGVTFTLVYTFSLTAQRAKDEILAIPVALTTGWELAVKLGTGSAANVQVGVQLRGVVM